MSTNLVFALLILTIAITICEAKPYSNSISEDVNSSLTNLKATLDKTVKACLDRFSTLFKNYHIVAGGIMDSAVRQMRILGENTLRNIEKHQKLAEDQGVDVHECLDGIKSEINTLSIKNFGDVYSCMTVEDEKLTKVFETGNIELKIKGGDIGKEVGERVLGCDGEERCLRDVLGEIQGLEQEGPNELYRMMNDIIWNMKELQSNVVVCGFSGIGVFGEIVKRLEIDRQKCIFDKVSNKTIKVIK